MQKLKSGRRNSRAGEDGYLIYVDDDDGKLMDVRVAINYLKKEKKLYVTLAAPIAESPDQTGLPTAYQETKEPTWDQGGESYLNYDLGLQ